MVRFRPAVAGVKNCTSFWSIFSGSGADFRLGTRGTPMQTYGFGEVPGENPDQKEVQFFTPATAGRNRTKTCDPRQLVALKNFTEAIFEILIFSPTFSRILKKVTFSRFFGTPGSLHGLPYTHQHPQRGFLRFFRGFSSFFDSKRCQRMPADLRRRGISRGIHF